VGFEPTIPAFERVKTVYVLDRVATPIGTETTLLLTEYYENNQIKADEMVKAGYVARMKRKKASYKVFMGKP
jgi:hypothetical protein